MYYFIAIIIFTALGLFIQKVAMKGRLERGLGRKVTDEELTSLSAWMEADSRSQAVPPMTNIASGNPLSQAPVQKAPAYYDADFVNSGVNWVKVILYGFLVLVVLVAAIIWYGSLPIRPPKLPAGTFPAQVGRFKRLDTEPSYEGDDYTTKGKQFVAEYNLENNGTAETKIIYYVWLFPSVDEARSGLQKKLETARKYENWLNRIVQTDQTRFVELNYAMDKHSVDSTDVYWVDGTLVMGVYDQSQQLAYEFEGQLRNRPPAALIPDPPDLHRSQH